MDKENRERKVVQDIVPSSKRTIRDVSRAASSKKRLPVEEDEGEEVVPIKRPPVVSSIARSQARYDAPKTRPTLRQLAGDGEPASRERVIKVAPPPKRRFPSILLTFLIVFIGIAVIAVALSLLYSKAAVTITPKTAHIDINGTFTAKKAGDSTLTSGALAYETVSVTDSMSQTVPATDGPTLSNKAKGTATLYNEQATQQKIVAGTRLANGDGDIYRTTTTVTIPAGKEGAPGKVDAAILADQAGAQYNMNLSDPVALTIVAYKGTPKYETVYGKIKTAITGGFAGKKQTISPDVQKAAVASLKDSLNTKLLAQAKTQIAKDELLYPNSYVIEYETPEPVAKGADSAEITVKGTFTGAVFKKTGLLKSIAAKELDKFPAPTYDINEIEDLRFTLVNSKDFSPRKGTPIIFSLKGPVDLVGTINETALKEDLKGTNLKDSNTIFAKYPSIANAYALITPFWMRSFPNSPDKIIIELKK